MGIKETFIKMIYDELRAYKEKALLEDKEQIFGKAYEIDVVSNLCIVLEELADDLSEIVLKDLVSQGTGILESLYQKWLKKEDSSYRELKEHVEAEIRGEAS